MTTLSRATWEADMARLDAQIRPFVVEIDGQQFLDPETTPGPLAQLHAQLVSIGYANSFIPAPTEGDPQMSTIKTPEEVAADTLEDQYPKPDGRDGWNLSLPTSEILRLIQKAIETDRAQRTQREGDADPFEKLRATLANYDESVESYQEAQGEDGDSADVRDYENYEDSMVDRAHEFAILARELIGREELRSKMEQFGTAAYNIMDGQEWSSDTLQDIGDYAALVLNMPFSAPGEGDEDEEAAQ